jgi:RNA polymerase sigma factor for flagellar operon FliA
MTALAPDREQLICDHLRLVRGCAWDLAHGNPSTFDDLIDAGQLGLVQAAQRWNPQPGGIFSSYAYLRVRGAMLDYLRLNGRLGRHDEHRNQQMRQARYRFAAREHRFPSDRELAAELGWTPRELSLATQQILRGIPRSLEECVAETVSGDEYCTLEEVLASDENVEADVLAQADRTELRDLLLQLPDRDRLVISLYFWEGMVLREIGEVLGVTESRVCQILTRALERLREMVPDDLRVAA